MRKIHISSPLLLILFLFVVFFIVSFFIDMDIKKQEKIDLTEDDISGVLRMIKLSALDEECVQAVIYELKKMINDPEINKKLDSINLKELTKNIKTISDPRIKALLERFL